MPSPDALSTAWSVLETVMEHNARMFKALLIDDEESIVRLFSAILERDGFRVTPATSAAQGCALLRLESYNVVVTDLKMETPMAGFEVVRAARSLHPRPLIVLLTAFPVPPAQWRGAGADALFIKGENIRSLPAQIKALLRHQPERAKLEPAAAGVGT